MEPITLKNSVGLKVGLIIILVLLFLIPLLQIDGLVRERKEYKKTVLSEVTRSWGGPQHLGSIHLGVPVLYQNQEGNKDEQQRWVTAWVRPEELQIQAELKTEVRRRAIYEVPLYRTSVQIRGKFLRPEIRSLLGPQVLQADWDRAFVVLSIEDARGLKQMPEIIWNGSKTMVQAQPEGPGLYQTHLGTRVSVREEMHFEYNLELHGSSFLGFLPLAPRTVCSINGDWKDPGFSGYRLPDERDIQGKGFRASWQILNLEGEIPAVYLGADDYYHTRSLELSTGVDLVTPLDIYQTVSRSLKYGFLFILLPFMVLFLMEALTGIRVHVVQYLLVGLSNVVFYLLLLSLAEHIGYLASYIVSALAVTALLLYYLEAVLGGMKKALVYLPLQLLLYLLMYIMLSSVDYALLIGAWGVFVILGVVMVLTRRTDWFGLGSAAGPDKQKSGQSLPVEPGRQS